MAVHFVFILVEMFGQFDSFALLVLEWVVCKYDS